MTYLMNFFLQTVAVPCVLCLPGPCGQYRCNGTCTTPDPYIIPISFSNLTLSPGYQAPPSNQSTLPSNDGQYDSLTSNWFQPSTYYITVEAITASGRRITASSNGVTIDTSPPILVTPIEHFDVSFSSTEPVRFQGNNNTISARWMFRDEQSSIIENMWAIGSSPFATDVQPFTSVGLSNAANVSGLTLLNNVTYYISVVVRNGAGLTTNVTSTGVTFIATQLNVTMLSTLVNVEFTEALTFTDTNGERFMVRKTDRDFRASVSWEGVERDIEDLCKLVL